MTVVPLRPPPVGRVVACEVCGERIEVFGHVPARFVGGACGCLRPTLNERIRMNAVDPATASWPKGYGEPNMSREGERRYESWLESLKDHGP